MASFGNMPINRKLTIIILMTCTAALFLVGTAMIATEWVTSRQALIQSMTVQADLLGRNCAAPLSFHREEDLEEANTILSAAQADHHVLAASLYDKSQRRFGEYVRAGTAGILPEQPPPDGARFIGGYLELAHPIMHDQTRLGTIFLCADLGKIYRQLALHAGIVGLALFITIMMAFIVAPRLRRPIAEPILALADVARHIAENRDYSVRAVKRSKDEVGLLTDAFNQMLIEIEKGQQSLQLGQTSLERAVNLLASSSGELLATSTALASGAIETATAVRQTTTTVDQVRATTLVSNQMAQHVADSAQKVVLISLSGKKSVESTIEGMERVRCQVESIAESMTRLSEQTQAIGQIIAAVDELAAQSNLLAVNASIEAAKAGDYGKGFMVVALEVRNLSDQSKQATKQVRSLLNDIQKATGAAVMATEQGSKAAEAGRQQSGQSGESIHALSSSVTEAAQAATQIAASSQQQLAGVDQVASAMQNINQATAQTASIAKQLEAAAHNLKEMGANLKNSMERHKQPKLASGALFLQKITGTGT